MRILVVEDEVRLADALSQILRQEKYAVDVAYDGTDGLDRASSGEYDVIVLDIMLPGLNGFEVVKALRAEKIATPVLMLTARDDVADKVMGLDRGADDYMTKPFAPEELLARVRALSRRLGEVALETLSFGDLTLGLSDYTLRCGSKSIRLGQKEYDVLRLLMANPAMVMPKETLLIRVWGSEGDAMDNNVEVYMSFLRKKFQYLGSAVTVQAVRKVGYRLEEAAA